jgi:hypothetical protein
MTSTVVPLRMVMTSLGRCASAPGMFSARQSSPVTSMRTSRSASAAKTPTITAAPPMSPFIDSMISDGLLSEMPPVSKVMPLPTNATFATGDSGR